MFGAVLAGAVCMNMPQAAFAYDVPEMIEVGLESVCKNATLAPIGNSQLTVGTLQNDKFREDGTISSSGGFTAKMVKGEVTEKVPASVLQLHPDCTLIADEAAGGKL